MTDTNMSNKYDQINLPGIIKAIQEGTIKLMDPEKKKKTSTTLYNRQVRELRDMRASATGRLKKMDRSTQEFFFVGSLVSYFPYVNPLIDVDDWDKPTEQVRNALVTGWDQDNQHVHVQLEGEIIDIVVHPNSLKLKHLRETY